MKPNFLSVAEQFYSVQGEGKTIGTPSIFLRLAGCNLMCGGHGTEKDGKLHGSATWRCDTIEVWQKGERKGVHELAMEWQDSGWTKLLKRRTHLVVTGGEPLLQARAVVEFWEVLEELMGKAPFLEVETNGTIDPTVGGLSLAVDQWNVSPKLHNSGMERKVRVNPDALMWFSEHDHVQFKFVVRELTDVHEVLATYVNPRPWMANRVYLMPGADTREELERLRPWVIDVCKDYGFKYSDRLHLQVWDKKTGV